MNIIHYPHPTLRHVSKPLKRVDAELKNMVAEMFELMYEAKGIGLAANQVDLPFQLFVINLEGQKSKGEELVFINPVVDTPKSTSEAEEGCLSLPGVHGLVGRPESIRIRGFDLEGNEIDQTVNGLLARAIQHENDHVNGVMFIDRLADSAKKNIAHQVEEFELEFQAKRASGEIGSDEEIQSRLKALEDKYC